MGKKSDAFIKDISSKVDEIKKLFDEWVEASLVYDKLESAYSTCIHDEWDAAEKTFEKHLTELGKYNQYKLLSFEQQDKFRAGWKAHKEVQKKLNKLYEARNSQLALKRSKRAAIVAKRKPLEKKLAEFKTFLDKKINWFGKTTKKSSVAYHKEVSNWLQWKVFS